MAKQSGGSERSKVRVFFVEADLGPGDMQELTLALTTAIRPYGTSPRAAQGKLPSAPLRTGAPSENEAETDLAELEFEEAVATPSSKTAAKARNYRKPVPVELNMKAGGVAFEEFAKKKAPSAHRGKYLVAAAWLHDYAKETAITADHIFTCYKAAGWTFDVQDPTATFRQLKSDGVGGLKRGTFSINHLGLAEVEKMASV